MNDSKVRNDFTRFESLTGEADGTDSAIDGTALAGDCNSCTLSLSTELKPAELPDTNPSTEKYVASIRPFKAMDRASFLLSSNP